MYLSTAGWQTTMDRQGRLALRDGQGSSSLGRASETDMKHITAILRSLRCNSGVKTVDPMQFILEAAKDQSKDLFWRSVVLTRRVILTGTV